VKSWGIRIDKLFQSADVRSGFQCRSLLVKLYHIRQAPNRAETTVHVLQSVYFKERKIKLVLLARNTYVDRILHLK
jgi:hypothetical protein